MKVLFAGTPDFAVPALEALQQSRHTVLGVLTQPDRPAGRGKKLTASPIKRLAQAYTLPVFQPKTLRDPNVQQQLQALEPDVLVVVAYGLIIPPAVLAIPTHGAVNIHPSKLPRWRGAAPIQHTLLAGDTQTAVCIMQLDEGLDTGPILLSKSVTISPDETAAALHDRLSALGAQCLLQTLDQLEQHTLTPQPQSEVGITYAEKIRKQDAAIDWHQPASTLSNQVRALNSWPVAYTHWAGQTLRIWSACPIDGATTYPPGTLAHISKTECDIATGKGLLRLTQVQLPGGKPIAIADFINAHRSNLIAGETTFTSKAPHEQ